jgi:hypothetical protein
MTDPFAKLAELSQPELDPSLSFDVLTQAHAILDQRRPSRGRQRWELAFAAIVGTLGLLYSGWAVGFINQLYR